MRLITSLLEKYRNLVAPHEAIKEAAVAFIEKRWQTKVFPAEISVKRGTLFINASSALRSEIVLCKEEFLEELKKQTGTTLSDIR